MTNMSINRRDLGRLGVGATFGAAAAVATGAQSAQANAPLITPPDLSFLRSNHLADFDRLRFYMRERGLDGLIVTNPANVFYLSNHWPQLDRMGFDDTTLVVVSADPARPPVLIMHAFLYYYTHSPETEFFDRPVFTYTQPSDPPSQEGSEPPAQDNRTMRVDDEGLVTDRERHRRRMASLTNSNSAGPDFALMKTLRFLGLENARLGFDEYVLQSVLMRHHFRGELELAENVIRKARLAKSDTEIRMMRIAAQSNVDAAMATAMQARELGTSRSLRNAFYGEAGKRGNIGKFMIVQGSSAEVLDEELKEGTSVSIDCVSSCKHYHGDFGRTIFIGEPSSRIQNAGAAIMTAWGEIKQQLRPGMLFSDIRRIGRDTLKKLDAADLSVSFTPHSVGLFHTDHPQPSLLEPREPDSLALEKNMILSVDCPLFVAGMGGTFHFENLMLITDSGAEAIHSDPSPIVIV